MPTRLAVPIVVLLAACGDSSSDGDPVVHDAGPPVDAGPECSAEPTVSESLEPGPGGNTQAIRQPVEGAPEGQTEVLWSWVVAGRGERPDYYTLFLRDPVPLETTLDLVDACTDGAPHCWFLETDVTVTTDGYTATQLFYPDQGTLVVHEAGPTGSGRLRLTISDAKFFHYVEAANGWSPAGDHGTCTTTMPATLEVDVEIAAPVASGKPRPMR